MDRILIYALITTLAGIGIPIMASLNAGLGVRVQSPAYAASILFVVGLIISIFVLMFTEAPIMPSTPPSIRYYMGGIFVAFYILTITAVAPRFGIGNSIFFVLLGQIVAATIIDHFGAFGAIKTHATPVRLIGIALMTIGVLLARKEI